MKQPGITPWQDLRLVAAGAALGVLAVIAMLAFRTPPERARLTLDGTATGWTEIAWPFLPDPWWPSKAFTCPKAVCGANLTLYVRAKIGFCNCKTGVADDEELERIADFALIAASHAPTRDGREIRVASMKGRSRPYALVAKGAGAATRAALLIGYNDRCDAMVATALVDQGDPIGEVGAVEAAILEFLSSRRVMEWTERTLGL